MYFYLYTATAMQGTVNQSGTQWQSLLHGKVIVQLSKHTYLQKNVKILPCSGINAFQRNNV